MNAAEVMAAIKASDKPFYTYVLSRPDGVPFYVGIGRDRRILHHRRDALRPEGNGLRLKIIRKIWKAGLEIDYRIEAFFMRFDEAKALEVDLIARFGRIDRSTGTLANHTDGGDGVAGRPYTEKQRQATIAAHRGAKRSKSTCRLLSDLQKAKWQDDATRERMISGIRALNDRPDIGKARSASTKAAWADPTKRAAMCSGRDYSVERMANLQNANRARMSKASERKKLSIISTEQWADPAYRERHAAAMKIAMNEPALKAVITAKSRSTWACPDRRAKQAASIKALWATPEYRELMMSRRRAKREEAQAQ